MKLKAFATLLSAFALICTTSAFAGPGDGTRDARVTGTFIPANDLQFIDALGPHHQMAVQMAEQEVARGSNAEVKAMAVKMTEMQLMDIEKLKHARHEIMGNPNFRPMHDPHSEHDLAELRKLSGIELDRAFLKHMIPHHAEALSVAHRALRHLKREDMHELAKMNIQDQAKEIGEMQELLEAIGE